MPENTEGILENQKILVFKYKGWRTKCDAYNEDQNLSKPLSMLLFMLILIGQSKAKEQNCPTGLSCNIYISKSKSPINIALDCKYCNEEYGNGPLYNLSRGLALKGPEKSSKLEI